MNEYNAETLPAEWEGASREVGTYGGYRYAAAPDDDSADLGQLLHVLRDKLWLLVVLMLAGGVLGFMYSRNSSLSYKTTASVWLERPHSEGPIRAADVLSGGGWHGVFLSHTVTEPVVHRFRLHIQRVSPPGPNEILDGLEITGNLRPGTFQIRLIEPDGYELLNMEGTVLEQGRLSEGVGRTRGFHWVPDPADFRGLEEDLVFQVRRPDLAANSLRARFSVRYEDMASMMITELRWPDPNEGAAIHNALVESFIETAARLTNGRLREEVKILEQQADYAAAQLQQAEMALQQFRVESITEPGEPQLTQLPDGSMSQDPLFGGFYQQQAQLDQIEVDLAELDAIIDRQPGEELNLLRLRLVPSIQNYPAIGATISLLDQLRLEVRTLLYTYRPEHPDVVGKSDQIRDVQDNQLPALIRELQIDLRNRRSVLQGQIDLRAEELRQIPTRSIEQGRLERRATLAEGLHNTLMGRLQTSRLAQQTSLSNVRPLDSAFVPGGPEARTMPQFFILLGSAAGLGLGIAGLLVRDRLDSRIRHPNDVSGLGMPLLGVVPQLKAPDSNEAVAAVAVESFRSIRTQLSHAHGRRGGLVLITSSTPREGKSVVAANLAISYASSGLRTLLIDADVRRGRLHTVFKVPRSPGLSEYLAGEVTLEEAVRRQDDIDLDVLCSGALNSDAELIGGHGTREFLRWARETYDAVILDGPPLAAGADALILGQNSDQVVMVFRAGATSEGMVRSRLGMLGNVEMPIVGAVLNAVPEHAPYYDQYVNYYYYAGVETT